MTLATGPGTASNGSDRGDDTLDELLEEIGRRLRGGEDVDLEAYAARYPAHAEALRRAVSGIRALISAAHPEPGDAPRPAVLGDFRVLREVGRGGMGVVYEAEQVSLRRRVALKVLPTVVAADPKTIRRFHLEAQAAALLNHPHVVPVHAVGCEGGVHFYVMPFIEGRSLAEVIRALGSAVGPALTGESDIPPGPADDPGATAPGSSVRGRDHARAAAQLGLQAAGALEHAHQQGVVHRDVKPSNLLIDAGGHLWVADFGLARLQNDAGLALTATGDLVGTLRYMSPEQASSRRVVVDHRTDVYSLGATLYELLTLRPAFEGHDRADVLRRIVQEDPKPLRRLNPAVPRDLETVVLKAMDKDPASRYSTAGDLADDLRRFLEGRPVKARRPSAAERAFKWSQRHPSLAASYIIALTLLSLTLGVSTVWIARERATAEAERRRAEETSSHVIQGITEPLKKLGNPDLAKDPDLAEMRRRIVSDAAYAYEGFVKSRRGDLEGRHEAIDGLLHLGHILTIGGDHPKAWEVYRRAAALADAMAAEHPSDGFFWDQVGQTHSHLGMDLWFHGRIAGTEAHLRAAAAGYDRALRLKPDVLVLSHSAWFLIVCPDLRFRDPSRGVALSRRLVELATPLGMDRPRFSGGVRPLFTLGLALYRAGDLAGARQAVERSMRLREGGEAYEWFVMAMIEAREGRRSDCAREFYDKAVRWTKWNRYSDFDLHFLDAEAAGLLAKQGR